MATVLNDVEARLLGVLIEKELTTPDQYPLSTNALRTGSNQKSNRSPATSYGEAEVFVGTQGLEAKGLANRIPPGMGSRTERFEHTARAFLSLDRAQLAVIAELLLRGPQQPGELRTRANRMNSFDTLAELSHVLEKLIAAKLVKRLSPSPGTRAERYRELLSSPAAAAGAGDGNGDSSGVGRPSSAEEIVARHDAAAASRHESSLPASATGPAAAPGPAPTAATPRTEASDRVAALESRVEQLERRLDTLLERLGEEL